MRGGYGARFCSQDTEFHGHNECRGTILLNDSYLKIVTNVTKWALAQCRGKIYPGATKLSRFRILMGAVAGFASRSFSEGWCPGAASITKLSWKQGQNQKP